MIREYEDDDNEIKHLPFRDRRTPRKTLIKKQGSINEQAEKGTVIALRSKTCIVERNSEPTGRELIECFTGGTILSPNEKSTVIAVGDRVHFRRQPALSSETELPTGTIIGIDERKTWLSRKAAGNVPYEHVIASNIDQVVILMASFDPQYNRRLIDRYLIAAELGDITPVICINKTDLCPREDMESDFETYRNLGIDLFFISALKGEGVSELEAFLKDKVSVLSGPSGTGKSTLINRLLGDEVQAVMDISEKWRKGRHATSFVRMFDLPAGGRLVDSPGIREFALWGIEKEEIPLFYHDFAEHHLNCKYLPCTHTHEPGCAVIEALEKGELDPQRYESYLNLYDSIDEKE